MIPFISDDDLSAYLGTTVSEADLNVVIALDAACQQVRDEIHRDVNLVADDEVLLNGPGTPHLLLPERPVVDVASITVDDEVIDPAEYVWDTDTGIVVRLAGNWSYRWSWSRGRLNTSVVYSHGWALAEGQVSPPIERVPSSIRLVALRLAAAVYRPEALVATTGGPVESETIGSYTYTLEAGAAQAIAAQALTDDDRRSLRPWVDARVA